MLSAKTARNADDTAQLDFFDLGLLPLLEREVRTKLDGLLRQTVSLAVNTLGGSQAVDAKTYAALFRLLFRLLAAKILADRKHPGTWLDDDPEEAIRSVENFYFHQAEREHVLDDRHVQELVWAKIRDSFHFQNLSVDALAFVYENTLVSTEARQSLGIHGTPPEIAEYIVSHLPIESLPEDKRQVFEPFSGHAVFLVAAMRRLRDLLAPTMTSDERHAYFVQMLAGLELDDFAREVGMLSLMLADYPNPDGWRLDRGDAFSSPTFDQQLRRSSIVLSNPPFEDFSQEERRSAPVASAHKPAELLRRLLQSPPAMMGLVLPRVALTGLGYKESRARLRETYGSLEVVALPDSVFRHSEADVALLLAYDLGKPTSRLAAAEVYDDGLQDFYLWHRPSYQREVQADSVYSELDNDQIWISQLQDVWKGTTRMPRLGELAEIHRGIEFSIPLRTNPEQLIADRPRSNFARGLHTVEDSLEPYRVSATEYLNVSPEFQRTGAYKWPWDDPKVIVNARRRSRGHWRITAASDSEGLVCYQNFHAIWPNSELPIEVLAAILNGPVANAFIATEEAQRDIRISTLKELPIPNMSARQSQAVSSLVRRYVAWRGARAPSITSMEMGRDLLLQIDAEVLRAYDFSPRVERRILDFFMGQSRPGPVDFTEYFPQEFKPSLPLFRYISDELSRATATSTLQRLPIVDDAAISEALAEID
ncbi:MAG: SAM-dependent DNA methyltransferase [Chloroflexi bacterium]|nr:SAM-dependent DNA methyltransferase [Chloroflexota bacterium]